jgi:hypothetical protein
MAINNRARHDTHVEHSDFYVAVHSKEPTMCQWHAKLSKLTTMTDGSTNVVQLPTLLSESVEQPSHARRQ